MPNSEGGNVFLLRLGTSLGCLFLTSYYNIMMKVLVYVMKPKKKKKRHTDLKERNTAVWFLDGCLHRKSQGILKKKQTKT